MSTTRTGKIARLPLAIRTQLNQRLRDGERGRKLIAWLNALPEVQAILAQEFGAQPISECNFTAWRHGGFRQWLQEQEAQQLARHLSENVLAGGLDAEGAPPLSESLAWWITANYCVHRDVVTNTEGTTQWKFLRAMCQDIVALRRADHRAERLDIEREWQEIARDTNRPDGRPWTAKAIKRSSRPRPPKP